ncbi:MAG: SLBB domain-containing protein, partial [Sphingomonadales bacterium]
RIMVHPGSGVRFNSLFVEQEPGAVLLSGEFRRPGVYNIRRGETLTELIERAGGLTNQAYPYGAVFTRERVRQAQQDGFKRTERELNMGLATAALKQRELNAEVLVAAQQLAERIATTEALGRVVTEVDPAALELRPEADTVLEPGDQIHIPKRPNYVLILGDVLNPGAVQFEAGKNVQDYISEAGGIQRTADKGRLFVVLPNGVARPVRMSSWTRSDNLMVPPGASIIVPKDVEPLDTLMLVRDLTAILSQLAVSAASIAVITR